MESDSASLQRYAGYGDAEAFTRLVRSHAGMVFATAKRITQDPHLAEDVTQNAFLALARDARQVRSNVVGWLHRTATHRALDAVRSRQRRSRHEHAAARREAGVGDVPNDLAELLPAIDAAIANLPDELRLPLVLHFLQSRSQERVAAELGVDPSTVSRRITRAIDTLRSILRREGLSPAVLPGVLGQCGPQAVPAALESTLVKIGLGGVGVQSAATVGVKLLAGAAIGLVLVGVAVWAILAAIGRPAALAVTPPTAPPAPAVRVPATVPTTRPAIAPPAIDLIRDAIRSESWVDAVQSLSIESRAVWHRSPEAAAARAAALKKQFPGTPLTPEKFPELKVGDSMTQDHLAFDARRVRSLHTDDHSRTLSVWDGARGYMRAQYFNNSQDGISIHPTLDRPCEGLWGWLHWPRAGGHTFWWTPPPRRSAEEREHDKQMYDLSVSLRAEAAVRGPVYYRGVWCWVVIFREQGDERWYVGMDDHRLYRMTRGVFDAPNLNEAYVRAAAARGKTIRTSDEFWDWQDKWCDSFPKDQRQLEFERLLGDVNINVGLTDATPRDDQWLGDYREVAPGCWLPFQQGWIWRTTENGVTLVDENKDLTVTGVRVNQPLPDEWFAFSFADAEGADVYDETFSPPLIYKWKKDRTPEEWQAVFDEAKKRQADQQKRDAALQKMLGQPAPAFANGQWLNGPPLTWAGLKGKVVLLNFWAEWCGPCHNDLPRLADLSNDAASPITVIGVHTAGSSRARIDAHLLQFGIGFPVYVDVKGTGRGFGALMEAFGVSGIPQTSVIGPDGRIAAQGPLRETLPIARKLAGQAASRPAASP